MNIASATCTQHLLTSLLNADAEHCATDKHLWGSLGGQHPNGPAPGSADLQQWSATSPQVQGLMTESLQSWMLLRSCIAHMRSCGGCKQL